MGRLLNVAMAIAILLCALGLVSDSRRLTDAQAELTRLEAEIGQLAIDDPSHLYLSLLKNNSPNELVWRVYLPGNVSWQLAHRHANHSRGSSGFSSSDPKEMLIRMRLTIESEDPKLYILTDHGSSTTTLSANLVDLISRHWDDLEIEIAGRKGPIDLKPDGLVTLLSVVVPEEVLAVADDSLHPYTIKRLQRQPLLQIILGESTAVEKHNRLQEQHNAQ